jgi:hypothetical protein
VCENAFLLVLRSGAVDSLDERPNRLAEIANGGGDVARFPLAVRGNELPQSAPLALPTRRRSAFERGRYEHVFGPSLEEPLHIGSVEIGYVERSRAEGSKNGA